MAEKMPQTDEGAAERGSRFFRNLNAVGAIALVGVGIAAPAGTVVFNTLAAINAAQAGFFEAARRHFKKKRQRKSISKPKKS